MRGSLAARKACGPPHDCPMVATFDVSTLPYSTLSLRLFSEMAQSKPLIRTAGSLTMSGLPLASFSFATAAMLPRMTRKGMSLRPTAITRYPCDASSPRNRVNSTDVFLHPPFAHSKTGSLGVFERSAGLYTVCVGNEAGSSRIAGYGPEPAKGWRLQSAKRKACSLEPSVGCTGSVMLIRPERRSTVICEPGGAVQV